MKTVNHFIIKIATVFAFAFILLGGPVAIAQTGFDTDVDDGEVDAEGPINNTVYGGAVLAIALGYVVLGKKNRAAKV